MSITNINSLSSACLLNSMCQNISIEEQFQKAFEKLNVNLIIQLLDQGANPNQAILYNDTLRASLCKLAVDLYYNRESCIEDINRLANLIESLQADEIAQLIDTKETEQFFKQAQLVKQDLDQGLPVSDETLKELSYQIALEECCNCCNEGYEQLTSEQFATPLQIATEVRDHTLIDKLIAAGAKLN